MLAEPEINPNSVSDPNSASETSIRQRIRDYIGANLLFDQDGPQYGDDVSFLEHHIIDSAGVLELIFFVEETYGITIDGRDMVPANFDSITNLARYIQDQLAARAGNLPCVASSER